MVVVMHSGVQRSLVNARVETPVNEDHPISCHDHRCLNVGQERQDPDPINDLCYPLVQHWIVNSHAGQRVEEGGDVPAEKRRPGMYWLRSLVSLFYSFSFLTSPHRFFSELHLFPNSQHHHQAANHLKTHGYTDILLLFSPPALPPGTDSSSSMMRLQALWGPHCMR